MNDFKQLWTFGFALMFMCCLPLAMYAQGGSSNYAKGQHHNGKK